MNYRLLNIGEEIKKGDQHFLHGLWTGVTSAIGGKLSSGHLLIRRPIESGWIKLSERKPTEADADENGEVVGKYDNGKMDIWNWQSMAQARPNYFWMPTPKLAPENEEKLDEIATDAYQKLLRSIEPVKVFREAMDAARQIK